MSMSIPVFFEPVREQHRHTDMTHLIVDGGMLSNFPVWLFDSDGEPDWPTFGLLLVDPQPNAPSPTTQSPDPSTQGSQGTIEFLSSLVRTMMEAHDRLHLGDADFVRTIAIDNLGVGTTEFDLPPEKSRALYETGRRAAEAFLADWSFEGYVEAFRKGVRPSRRQRLAARLREATTTPVGVDVTLDAVAATVTEVATGPAD
jgi:NTE family protein